MPQAATPTAIPAAGTRVTGGIDPARLNLALRVPMTAALERIGEIEVSFIQQTLDTPVGVSVGPMGGVRIERSKKGEYPRMDQGVLVRNVRHAVVGGDSASLPHLVVSVSRPPRDAGDDPRAAYILEFVLDRPILVPALYRLRRYVRKELAKIFGSA
jgi:hypothetical protein